MVTLGGELERPGQARLRAYDVERERPSSGEGEIADRSRLELLRFCVAGDAGELECLQVVVGEHVGQVLGPLSCFALDPGGGRAMAHSTGRARDLRVADVSDQRVPEAVLLLSLHRARASGAYQLLAGQLVQVLFDLARVAAAHLAERARPEHLPDNRCVLEQALPRRGEGVQPGGDQRLHRVGEGNVLQSAREQVAVCEQAHKLLRVERVSACSIEERALCLDGQHGLLEQEQEQAGGVLVRERT